MAILDKNQSILWLLASGIAWFHAAPLQAKEVSRAINDPFGHDGVTTLHDEDGTHDRNRKSQHPYVPELNMDKGKGTEVIKVVIKVVIKPFEDRLVIHPLSDS